MRYIRYAFWAIVAVILVTVSFANRGNVELKLLSESISTALPETLMWLAPVVTVPLFVAILIGVAVGLVIGLIWEWIREAKQRAEANRRRRRIAELEAQVARLTDEKHEGKDEVLALLDKAG
jgi:Protein of unknown function (DUF1049).